MWQLLYEPQFVAPVSSHEHLHKVLIKSGKTISNELAYYLDNNGQESKTAV